MEKEFVPYELAVKLKKLGFDEPCFATWSGETLDMSLQIPSDDYFTKAPLYQQAFRWFRDKYGIHSSPKKYDETKWWVEWGTWTSPVFETYEEAELACLDKLIEIVESKSE